MFAVTICPVYQWEVGEPGEGIIQIRGRGTIGLAIERRQFYRTCMGLKGGRTTTVRTKCSRGSTTITTDELLGGSGILARMRTLHTHTHRRLNVGSS